MYKESGIACNNLTFNAIEPSLLLAAVRFSGDKSKASLRNYVKGMDGGLPAGHLWRRGRLVVFPHPVRLPSSKPTSLLLLRRWISGVQGGVTTTGGEVLVGTPRLLPLVDPLLVELLLVNPDCHK